MAFESYYWRKDIKRDISFIKKKMEVDVSSLSPQKLDAVFSKVEIKLFTMAFSIRKLLETKKLPDRVRREKIKIVRYKRNANKAGPIFSFEKLYDFEHPQKSEIMLTDVLNQFIHGHVFQILPNDESKLQELMFTSDRDKNKHLSSLSIAHLISVVEKVSEDSVSEIVITYDFEKGDYVTKTS